MKPEVLSVKLGYNPNSSSVGMLVRIFMYQTFAISILFASIRLLLNLKKKKPTESQ